MIKIKRGDRHKIKMAIFIELDTALPVKDFINNFNIFMDRFKQTGWLNHIIPLWCEYDETIIFGDDDDNL